ncbi:MAG TPA: tripartite tricarboxylate transporter substrate binding protein [Ramlibacter sp.]|nr:tripartite tricarboxylate transporter substrate binding protein [Ramlibacter sp.]
MQRKTFLTALLATLALSAAWAQGPGWPERPVKMVLSQPAGSGPDAVARLIGDRLAKLWGQAVVIDNKPGGQNVIGANAVARSAPDGYTFYFATTAALVTNSYMFKQLSYDPQKDFVPVSFVARSPFAILVRSDSPVQTMDDLVARSKAAGGKYSIANEGPRTFGGMIARVFNKRTDAQANLVSYSSVANSVQDLVGGHVDAAVADIAATAELVKTGRLRMIAVTSAQRVPGFESVPTLAERLPGMEMVGWFAVVAPVGTPAVAIERFNKDLNTLLADRELIERIASIGPLAEAGLKPEQVAGFLKTEHARWGEITREIGLLPE